MKYKLPILAIILFLIGKCYISHQPPVTEPLKAVEWQKIYRCCDGKCYLLKSYIEQIPVKEVSYKEIYDNYDEETIIFSRRWCPDLTSF